VTADLALQLMGEMLFASLLVAGPILGISMVVGVAISVLQVVTQVQEMSLSFVPKIIAVIATLIFLGPWILKKLVTFASGVIGNIPAYF
jgi:flagellar biosynthetic protein FliQ